MLKVHLQQFDSELPHWIDTVTRVLPDMLPKVATMIAVPLETPVAMPPLSIVATVVSEELQVT